MQSLTPSALKAMLADGGEVALIDLREEGLFSERHLLFARSVPLSRLELNFARLVPRRATRIVLCDDNDGLTGRAAKILARAGYTNLFELAGGIAAWEAAGFPLFSGVNVPSKALGEFVEHTRATPSIDPDELAALMRAKADLVVLDSRPFDEYQRVSIPTAINVPGAELVLRVRDLAPSPTTTVVVNCAGRTRSIIGAQSLINAGVPNNVVALRNGTMGWSLAGFTCDHGKEQRAPSPSREALAWAKGAAGEVARRFGVERIDRATLARFRADDARTLYLFDVRDPDEYAAGHVAGAFSAPGGQLVQATDAYIGTLGARVVLIDDAEVRAAMTASWLRQMGFADVFVLAEAGAETGAPAAPLLGDPPPAELAIDCADLAALIARDAATVVDLSLSREYRAAHIPGAWFAIRARLAEALAPSLPSPSTSASTRVFDALCGGGLGWGQLRGTLVLTSGDGVLAGLAAREVEELIGAHGSAGRPRESGDPYAVSDRKDTEYGSRVWPLARLARDDSRVEVRWLAGGNAAWRAAGHPLTDADPRLADEPIDVWLKPYERPHDTTQAMRDYLAWEVDLPARIAADGTARFMKIP
jgi:rhodanese-related sulfurtransferase